MTALNTRRLRWLGCIGLLTLGVTFGMAPVSKILATNDHEASPDTLLGNYLAGRFARGQHDTSAAAGFYEKALAKDPKNEVILKQTFRLEAAAGNWDRATPLAETVIKGTKSHRTARFLLAVQAFREGRFQAAKDHLAAARTGPIVDLTSRLARAWIEIGEGKTDAAFKTLSQIKQADWSRFYQRYHKGLMADLAGRRDIARTELSQAFKQNPKTLRIAEAYARHAVNAGNAKLARQVLNIHLSRSTGHTLSRALLRDVKAGKKPGLLVASASAGIAEVFYGIGDALTSEGSVETGSVYLRLALLLKPDFPLVHVALGEVYETVRKYERAIEAYARVPESSPLWMNVQIRKGYSLNALKRVEEAKVLLERLADTFPKETRPLDALGSIMRSHKRFAEARDYYSRAIALVRKPTKRHWALFYSRGVSYERLKQWPKAEVDFKKALKLDPNKALVLNYLGYSWVDQGRNLKEAMALIRKAVKLKPDDGYFVDSLGWAYYRQGRYHKAVEHLERAVELRPDDPVINDHLGDAYWKVGRRLEAKFQWNQALSLKPEPDEEKKIKVKLAQGLQTERQTNAQVEANEKRPELIRCAGGLSAMAPLTELAAAKINLTLEILGRRPDGYHELVSLVAFAGLGDRLSLEPGPRFGLQVEGPFAGGLGTDNLIECAVRRALEQAPALTSGRFRLEKTLPVAAGLGGGSADAAAALRLLARANPEQAGGLDLGSIAAGIGADVTVCLEQRVAWMRGVGEQVACVPPLPETHVALVNPGVTLATAEVYAALGAPPLDGGSVASAPEAPGPFPGLDALLAYLEARGNDLEVPALRLAPEIGEVRDRLLAAEGCRLARLSGSGATWFGIFGTHAEAERAAARIRADRPGWWVVSSVLQ